jgi:hypothetical protein
MYLVYFFFFFSERSGILPNSNSHWVVGHNSFLLPNPIFQHHFRMCSYQIPLKPCIYLKNEERSPGKGSNDEQNGPLDPMFVGGPCGSIGSWVMHVLRPHKFKDMSFVHCHQHGSSHRRYRSHHLCLASHFLHVQRFHPVHPNYHKFMLINPNQYRKKRDES